MKRYILSVTPEDGDGATTVVHLDINGDRTLIKQVTVTAAKGQYLPRMPFDIEGLLTAVLPGTATPAPVAPAPAPLTVTPPRRADLPSIEPVATVVLPAVTEVKPEPSTLVIEETLQLPRPARKPRAATAPAQVGSTAAKATKDPAVKKAAAAKKTRQGKAAKAPESKNDRAYNKMPDDFVTTFGKTTMADLADVYNVPRHTIQGWATTARKQGKIPPATPRKKR